MIDLKRGSIPYLIGALGPWPHQDWATKQDPGCPPGPLSMYAAAEVAPA